MLIPLNAQEPEIHSEWYICLSRLFSVCYNLLTYRRETTSQLVRKLKLREGTNTAVLFGHHDRHLKLIEDELGVRLSARGEELTLDGLPEAIRQAERILIELASLTNQGYHSKLKMSLMRSAHCAEPPRLRSRTCSLMRR